MGSDVSVGKSVVKTHGSRVLMLLICYNEPVIEIRRHVTSSGKDMFGDWLAKLKDARTQAKVAIRINRLATGNFGDCKPLRESVCELRVDWVRGIACTTQCWARHVYCFLRAATNASNPLTSSGRLFFSTTTRKGREGHETQGEHFARRGSHSRTSRQSAFRRGVPQIRIRRRQRTSRSTDRFAPGCPGARHRQNRQDCRSRTREPLPCLVHTREPTLIHTGRRNQSGWTETHG